MPSRNRPSRWPAASLALLALLALAAPARPDAGLPKVQKSDREMQAIRDNAVGIVTGGPGGIYASLGSDLLRLLDDRQAEELRLSVLIGSGSIANLDDLRNLPGVSLAIVQGDVLAAYAADPEQFKWLGGNIRYVSRLHTEVLHVVTRRAIAERGGPTVCALRGLKVNVGGLGSGAAITVRQVFDGLLGLDVKLDPGSLGEAFDQLSDGRIDAIAYVVGRPAPVFLKDRLGERFTKEGFAWLDAPRALLDAGCDGRPPRDPAAAAIYEPATLTAADYPALIRPGQRVETLGVPAVLAAYRFDNARTARSTATARFIQRFLERAADPDRGLGRSGGGNDRNWCGIDLAAPVGGWQRHDAASAWLAANAGSRSPLPTRIACLAALSALPAFCRAKGDEVAEFNRQRAASGRRVEAADPDYLFAFADWARKTCP